MAIIRKHRVNQEIKEPRVRLANAAELTAQYSELGEGIVSTSEAIRIAKELDMDLVEIAGRAVPPVCRIISYAKFKEDLEKREKANKARQQKAELKEIRFGPKTNEQDFQFKLRHAENFLRDGNRLKAYVLLRGKQGANKNQVKGALNRFAEELKPYGEMEMAPVMEGNRMAMIIAPKK